jgi:shikimate dehydrogenase
VSQRRAAVLGSPIAHSLSPTLHRAAYAWLGLDWSYEAIEVDEQGLATFVAGLGPEWVGLSLTMPLKEAVLPLVADIDPAAQLTRAVNTVLLDAAGHRGFNTDIAGMVAVLGAHGVAAGARALVLGGGATARSTLAALARVGAGQATVAVRRGSVAAELAALGGRIGLPVVAGEWAQANALLLAAGERADVVVSTVPRGVADPLVASVPTGPAPALFVDVLYDPGPTPLAAAWQHAGGTVAGGRELLVGQAVEQVALMTGQRVPPEVLRAALPR